MSSQRYTVLTPLRVLVLGGRGNFGHRLVERLEAIEEVAVIVAGRREWPDQGGRYLQVDAEGDDLASLLRSEEVDVLVAAVGPFRAGDYRPVEAAIDAGSHYIDLSDCRQHVMGVSRFDTRAREAGVMVTSGASSVPALSSAVIDKYWPGFHSLDRIEYGITASELTPGIAAVESALAYCGKPIRSTSTNGSSVVGWQNGLWKHFSIPLGWRWLVCCDIPDLDIFPGRYGAANVIFRAGVASLPNMFGMWVLSWLVRWGLVRSAAPLARLLHRLAGFTEFAGMGRSGMYVRLDGKDTDGRHCSCEWQLIAGDNHGPYVPVLGAVALVRKLARQEEMRIGAQPCVGLLTLEEYCAEIGDLNIRVLPLCGQHQCPGG